MRRISDGSYPPGGLLPIETELAREFSCARATVNRAMRELAEDGIIDRKRRAGSRVNALPVRRTRLSVPLVRVDVTERGAAYRFDLISRQIEPASGVVAARMALPAKARVLHLTSVHFADDAPFMFERRWINLELIPDAEPADFSIINPNEWLVSKVPLSDLEMSFIAEGAAPEPARYLNVAEGTPLLTAERQTWLEGNSITVARLTYHEGYRLVTSTS